jgi:hypothetical protein
MVMTHSSDSFPFKDPDSCVQQPVTTQEGSGYLELPIDRMAHLEA